MSLLCDFCVVALRLHPRILACLLAGCATQPDVPAPGFSVDAPAVPPVPDLLLRIGVELLPPEANTAQGRTITEVSRASQSATTAALGPRPNKDPELPDRGTPHLWSMTASDLAAVDEPIVRETVQFIADLMREDDRAGRREMRSPLLEWQPVDPDNGPSLRSEEQIDEAHAEWIHEHGPRLLQKPARQLLRRLPLVHEFELEFQDFRSGHVPLSEPYRAAHGDQRRLGRMSLRVHTNDFQDPLEIVYMLGGVRVGSSQDTGKLSIDWELTERVTLEVRANTDYDSYENRVRADLAYWLSRTTNIHLCVGDDLDFLSTRTSYSRFDSPMDGTPGILLYAVHSF